MDGLSFLLNRITTGARGSCARRAARRHACSFPRTRNIFRQAQSRPRPVRLFWYIYTYCTVGNQTNLGSVYSYCITLRSRAPGRDVPAGAAVLATLKPARTGSGGAGLRTRGGVYAGRDGERQSSQVKSSRLSTVRTLHRHRSCQITVLPSALSFFDRSAIRDRGKQNEPEEAD